MYITIECFEKKVKKLAQELGHEQVVKFLLQDQSIFSTSGSSSINVHHYGTRGLAQHTIEVIELCKAVSNQLNRGSWEILFLAALFHDVGKAWDYMKFQKPIQNPEDWGQFEWKNSEHKFKIHHISRSTWVWRDCAQKANLGEMLIDEVCHCILSHHGRREWGSPIEPQTTEANILHHCDSISARTFECIPH